MNVIVDVKASHHATADVCIIAVSLSIMHDRVQIAQGPPRILTHNDLNFYLEKDMGMNPSVRNTAARY